VLADLVLYLGGYPFLRLEDAYSGDELEWSAVIWDLLQASRGRVHRKVIPDRSSPHLLEDEADIAGGSELADDDDDAGISVIRILIRMGD
jgi:hypothetical protein